MLLTPAKIERSKRNWSYIIIHHSWSTDNKITSNWEGIVNYHKSLGWLDVGYHFGIEYINNILILRFGRSLEMDGAHTLGFNDKAVGICLIGNYDEQIPTMEQMNAVTELCKILLNLYNIKKENVIGHRESYNLRGIEQMKTCPGTLFNMDRLREMLI